MKNSIHNSGSTGTSITQSLRNAAKRVGTAVKSFLGRIVTLVTPSSGPRASQKCVNKKQWPGAYLDKVISDKEFGHMMVRAASSRANQNQATFDENKGNASNSDITPYKPASESEVHNIGIEFESFDDDRKVRANTSITQTLSSNIDSMEKHWHRVFGTKVIREEIFRHVRTESAPSCANHILFLAKQNKGNPIEFGKILNKFFSENEVRNIGIDFGPLDDNQKIEAAISIAKIDKNKIDSMEIRGFSWTTPVFGSEGIGRVNSAFLGLIRSEPVRDKLTNLSMSFRLITHRGCPPDELFIGLNSLKKLDLKFSTPNDRKITLIPRERIDEIKIDFGNVESQSLRQFALLSTDHLIIEDAQSLTSFTPNFVESLKTSTYNRKFTQRYPGPNEITILTEASPELLRAAADSGLNIKFPTAALAIK